MREYGDFGALSSFYQAKRDMFLGVNGWIAFEILTLLWQLFYPGRLWGGE
jgi:hypothetical protein